MKKLVFIAIALFTLNAMAQQDGPRQRKGHDKERAGRDLSPEEMANLKTKEMTLHLDLTDAQQKKVSALMLAEAKVRKAKMEERKEKESSEKPSKEEHLKMMNERLDAQISMKREMKEILTAEQYLKFDKLVGDKENFRKKQRRGKPQNN